MKRLITVAGFVLVAACDSSLPTAPTARTPVQQPTGTPPGVVNTSEPGPVPIAGTTIWPGDSIDVMIEDSDPRCFPNWDSIGRCGQFDATVPADGTLVATLTASGPSRASWNPDVFIAASDGRWIYPDFGWPATRVSLPVERGLTYRVVVLSYGPFPDVLQLTVKVQ